MGQRGADFLVADLHHVFAAGVGFLRRRPQVEQFLRLGIELAVLPGDQCFKVLGGFFAAVENGFRCAQALALAGERHLRAHMLVVATHGIGDLGEVTHTVARDNRARLRGLARVHFRQLAGLELQPLLLQVRGDGLVKRGHAIVVEARGLGAEDRHGFRSLGETFAVALVLLAYVA